MYKLSVRDAREGMVLAEAVYLKNGTKLLLPSGAVLKESAINKMIDLEIQDIYVADPYTLFVSPIQKMRKSLLSTFEKTIKKYSSLRKEANKSDDMVEITKDLIKHVKRICSDKIYVDYCLQMRMLSTPMLYEHAVTTSVFSGLVAGGMKLKDEEIYNIMVGALLHNIGCLEMPFLIGVKDLKGQQELLWKEHPTYGYYFAIQNNISREIAEMIQFHHEKWDGSGYPKGLKATEIPLGARIIAVCSSVTDLIIFDKTEPYEALEFLYGTSNIYFDKEVVDVFSKNITLYPLGALVRLTTGEVGVICNVRKNDGPRPIVNVYFNRFNKPLAQPKIVDLGKERTTFISQIL